jgi:hypothetical protein
MRSGEMVSRHIAGNAGADDGDFLPAVYHRCGTRCTSLRS